MNDTAAKLKFPTAKFLLASVFGVCAFFIVGHFVFSFLANRFPQSLGGGNLVFLFSINSGNELWLAIKHRKSSQSKPPYLYLNLFNLVVGLCLAIYILASGHPISYVCNAIVLVSLTYLSFLPALLVARSSRMNSGISPRAA